MTAKTWDGRRPCQIQPPPAVTSVCQCRTQNVAAAVGTWLLSHFSDYPSPINACLQINPLCLNFLSTFIQLGTQQQATVAGVNICRKKSEIVYPPIWGILKLSVLLNRKILKLPF